MKSIIQIVNYFKTKPKSIIGFFVIFYLVGIIGMLLPTTHQVFIKLIPLALLLSIFAVLLFHPQHTLISWFTFLFIYGFSFVIEVIGVNTGIIFGNYTYGDSLGISLFNTPLIIGANWLLLVYLSTSILERLKAPDAIKIVLASMIMLGYDIIIEPIAPKLGMWYWNNNSIPLKNYITWILLALIFTTLLKVIGIKTRNKIAPVLLTCQLLFFIILLLNFKLKY